MKTGKELFAEHSNRLHTAIALETPDRVPVMLAADAFCANHMEVTLADYLTDMEKAAEIHLKSMQALGDIDAVDRMLPAALGIGAFSLANVKLPGRELAPNRLWQVDEVGLMTVADYDTVLTKGWTAFTHEFLPTRLPVTFNDLKKLLQTDFPKVAMNFVNAGIVPFSPVLTGIAFDTLSSARGMPNFTKDLFKMPDKLEAVMNVIMADQMEIVKTQIKQCKPFTVFMGCSRGASEFISPKMWQRFVWPQIKKMVQAIVEGGSVAYLHFDSNWDRDLEYFRELPKGKCIFYCDHATDIYKLKKVLGGHMCLMGDVPPSLLTLGTPDDVYQYSAKLINEIGPAGFILGAACCVPCNAKVENVKALVAAANDTHLR